MRKQIQNRDEQIKSRIGLLGAITVLSWIFLPLLSPLAIPGSPVLWEIGKGFLTVTFVAALALVARRNLSLALGTGLGVVIFGLTLFGVFRGCASLLTTSSSPPITMVKPLTAVENTALDEMQRDMEAGRFYDDEHYFRKYPGLCANARGLTAEERRRYCGR